MYEYNSVIVESFITTQIIKGVIKSFNGSIMIIQFSSNGYFQEGQNLKIKIFEKLNGYSIYTGIVKSYSDNILILHCIVLDNTIQRRKSKRLLISTPTNINRIIINKKKLLTLDKQMLMKAKDLSSSGILLESPLDIPENVNFIVDLPIDNHFITLKTTTMRKYKKNDLYYYGCTFSLQNEDEQSILLKYINSNYLTQIKNQSSSVKCYFDR